MLQMTQKTSPEVRGLLNILTKWVCGAADPETCLLALETVNRRWNTARRAGSEREPSKKSA